MSPVMGGCDVDPKEARDFCVCHEAQELAVPAELQLRHIARLRNAPARLGFLWDLFLGHSLRFLESWTKLCLAKGWCRQLSSRFVVGPRLLGLGRPR